MSARNRASGIALLLALLYSPGLAAAAQDSGQVPEAGVTYSPQVEQQARKLASSLRCPVCLNLSVQDSPSQLAREMKDLIRERLAQGESAEQIRRYFVEKYGEWILITPEPRGVNLALWVVPALSALAGIGLLGALIRRWVRAGGGATGGGSAAA